MQMILTDEKIKEMKRASLLKQAESNPDLKAKL